jgi:hypothetical protein
MAERRMFSKTIIDSDLFMDLPLTAQALYFHLAMRADDDGFIGNSKKLCRMLGVGEEDLALLIEKELLIKFDSGVVAVKHWKVNNLIKNDRYKATIYQEEKSFLEVENNTYRKCEKKPRRAPQKDEKATLEPKWNPSGTHLEPQVRLGKDSIGKDSIGKDIKREKIKREKAELSSPPSLEEVKEYGRSIGREDLADKFFKYYTATEWNDAKGKVINNWKAKYVSWSNREPKAEQVRYGNFEAKEAFEMALKRSYGDD